MMNWIDDDYQSDDALARLRSAASPEPVHGQVMLLPSPPPSSGTSLSASNMWLLPTDSFLCMSPSSPGRPSAASPEPLHSQTMLLDLLSPPPSPRASLPSSNMWPSPLPTDCSFLCMSPSSPGRALSFSLPTVVQLPVPPPFLLLLPVPAKLPSLLHLAASAPSSSMSPSAPQHPVSVDMIQVQSAASPAVAVRRVVAVGPPSFLRLSPDVLLASFSRDCAHWMTLLSKHSLLENEEARVNYRRATSAMSARKGGRLPKVLAHYVNHTLIPAAIRNTLQLRPISNTLQALKQWEQGHYLSGRLSYSEFVQIFVGFRCFHKELGGCAWSKEWDDSHLVGIYRSCERVRAATAWHQAAEVAYTADVDFATELQWSNSAVFITDMHLWGSLRMLCQSLKPLVAAGTRISFWQCRQLKQFKDATRSLSLWDEELPHPLPGESNPLLHDKDDDDVIFVDSSSEDKLAAEFSEYQCWRRLRLQPRRTPLSLLLPTPQPGFGSWICPLSSSKSQYDEATLEWLSCLSRRPRRPRRRRPSLDGYAAEREDDEDEKEDAREEDIDGDEHRSKRRLRRERRVDPLSTASSSSPSSSPSGGAYMLPNPHPGFGSRICQKRSRQDYDGDDQDEKQDAERRA